MTKTTRFVGLDVHSKLIEVAVAESGGEVRSLGNIPNDPNTIAKLMRKLGSPDSLRVCYEAGPLGYVLYWQLTKMGVHCEVIAPSLIPMRPGDRVKTDRRDALKLARCFRSGDLTPVWVPDPAHEALRGLVRAREAAKEDQLVARHRLQKFLLLHGIQSPHRVGTVKYVEWAGTLKFAQPAHEMTLRDYLDQVVHAAERIKRLEQALSDAVEQAPANIREVIAALQALRGVAKLTAMTIVSEIGQLSRFHHPRQLMGYSGAVPSEYSSGGESRRGKITKAGNAHLRRVLVESAWAYRYHPAVTGNLKKRQESLPPEIVDIANKAQHRLCARYRRLMARGVPPQKVITAIARELLGFVWAIGTRTERAAA